MAPLRFDFRRPAFSTARDYAAWGGARGMSIFDQDMPILDRRPSVGASGIAVN